MSEIEKLAKKIELASKKEVVDEGALLRAKVEYLAELEKKLDLQKNLPHLHGFKDYDWSEKFLLCRNRLLFLTAANQVGKSSTQIRKIITWATSPELWPILWDTQPRQFWYLYPSRDFVDSEFHTKWVPEFLPKGRYKDDPRYGWTANTQNKRVSSITFNTGVIVYFKTYMQQASTLQGGTVHYIACDEELPSDLFSELVMRTSAVKGHFSMVFTATLGQEFWRETMEVKGEGERFPQATKLQVSLYDCMYFADGTPSHFTKEAIAVTEGQCGSELERLKRVEGRFVSVEGRKYPSYDRGRNYGVVKDITGWNIFSGVDIGSGGTANHPAAIVFVAVNPNFREGHVFLCWRGDGLETTSGDVFKKYIELRGKMRCVQQFYDWHNKDFWTIATRAGEVFSAADKSHESGESLLNALFKNGMLTIADGPEQQKLSTELQNLLNGKFKTVAKDDLVDALRYAVTKIPWDWSFLGLPEEMEKKSTFTGSQVEERRSHMKSDEEAVSEWANDVESELEEWDQLINGY